ncbi:MAG: prepilin-type N-terminal cleavage/methylation domain-containing protein [Candidatus Methylacidiphilales bacterium]|nr:prepilin-type N-terminal cleavage/methylation domain-containing protein [Candidatus Methylacidiphilales bacterium]
MTISSLKTLNLMVANLSRFAARRRRSQGFTLVEVTMAVAIIAFAFVPLFGLLPVGFSVSREAMDITVTSQIAQRLTTAALQTDFSKLATLEGKGVVSYDDQGNLAAGTAGIYHASYNVSSATELPGCGATERLKTVTICVLNLASLRTSQESNLMLNPDTRKFVVLVPDNGR